MNILLDFLHTLPPFPLESEGGWENDTFEVTIFCRELISSWQTFSVVVDCYENPVHPLFDESTGERLSDGGLPCEIPDNGYPETWDNSWDSSTNDIHNYQAYTNFDESNTTKLGQNKFPEGVGEIFLTDNTNLSNLEKPGISISLSEEIYFSMPLLNDTQNIYFKNDQNVVTACITQEGNLYLKGKLITLTPFLKNDKEEIPSAIEEDIHATAIFGSYDWIIPSPTPTPIPTSLPDSLTKTQDKEMIIRNYNGDNIAILNYQTGNLEILGEWRNWDQNVLEDTNIRKFIIRTANSEESSVLFVDEFGNLYTKGAIVQNLLKAN